MSDFQDMAVFNLWQAAWKLAHPATLCWLSVTMDNMGL